MRRTGLQLGAAATLVVATLAGGPAVVLGAGASRPRGEALAPAATAGGPPGRLAVAGPWIEADDPTHARTRADWPAGGLGGRPGTGPDVAHPPEVTRPARGAAPPRGGAPDP